MVSSSSEITGLLRRWSAGDECARDQLIPLVYEGLRELAHRRLGGAPFESSLDTTELVHEAYLRLAPGMGERGLRNRYDFYGAAGEAMRRILIDHARRRQTARRGSGQSALPLSNVAQMADTADPAAVLALNEAFERLESESPDLAKLVRLRFFAGLDVAETAKALGVSEPTVKRRWRFARTVLFEALEGKV